MHQASVGFHCPDCTKKGAQQVYRGVASLRERPIVTYWLLGLNVAIFAIGALVARDQLADYLQGSITQFHLDWGVIGNALVRNADGSVSQIGVANGEPYRLVTSGFLHYGILHLAVNMWALWVLGQALEQYAGRARFAVIYGVALLFGSMGALLLEPSDLGAGASGAIFGLMGAMFIVMRVQGIPWRGSPLLNVLIVNLFITFAVPGISRGAHLGGLVGGLVAGWALFELARRPGLPKQVPWAVCAGVAIVAVGASMAFAA